MTLAVSHGAAGNARGGGKPGLQGGRSRALAWPGDVRYVGAGSARAGAFWGVSTAWYRLGGGFRRGFRRKSCFAVSGLVTLRKGPSSGPILQPPSPRASGPRFSVLDPTVIHAIRAMRAAGVTQSVVAARLGVSQRTIQRLDRAHRGAPPVAADPDPPWQGKPERCGQCGAMAVIEDFAEACRECRGEDLGRAAVRRGDTAGQVGDPEETDVGDDPLALDLRPGARGRYEAIRARKVAEDALAAGGASALDELPEPTDVELESIEGVKI